MKKLFSIYIAIFIGNLSFSQLPPEFEGSYLRDDFAATIELWADQEQKADFVFTLEFYKEDSGTSKFQGKGFVSEENIFYFEIDKNRYQGELEIDEYGLINLYLNYPKCDSKMHFTYASEKENYNEAVFFDAQIFLKEDGAELDIFDNHGLIGFRIITSDKDPCQVREFSGFMTPTDNEMTVLFFEDQNGCQLEFLSSEEGIFVNQTSCNAEATCEDFSGLYRRVVEE